jgi:YfiH family protein
MILPNSRTLTAHDSKGVVYYSFPALDAVPFVRHGFSTRLGGVSHGVYSTMNLSFTRGDEETRVRENFARFCAAVGVDSRNAVVAAQEHHTNVYNATAADRGRGVTRERGYNDVDGLITNEPDVVLFTQYADCVPLFFADPIKRVVGTAHAGWRGTAARISAVMVERLVADYGCCREDILAAIGPSIGPCCFEVDEPVRKVFHENFSFAEECTVEASRGKSFINLSTFAFISSSVNSLLCEKIIFNPFLIILINLQNLYLFLHFLEYIHFFAKNTYILEHFLLS